jgi:glc operon protein GlcG
MNPLGGKLMRSFVVTLFAACAALAVAGQASAQAPAPAPAAPAPVPDQMPFDIPYGPAITADQAAKVVAAAVEEAKKSPRNWKLAIAVVDPNGDLVYFYKMDQTQVASIAIAQGKARTAARFRRPSQVFFNVMQTPAGNFAATLDPTLVASPGGFPLVEGGKLIGAIGCSGATGDQDAVACKAGADTVK